MPDRAFHRARRAGTGNTASLRHRPADCLDQPTQYPPLLRPPANPDPPLAVVPRGPSGEYDHGHLYLPDYVPPSAPEACRPLGRWWISPSFEFAWLPSRHAPVNVRLRVPTPDGGSISGPVLPIAGQSADSFQAGFGLTGGWWFNERNTRGVDASFFTVGGGKTTYGFAPDMLILFPDGARFRAATDRLPARHFRLSASFPSRFRPGSSARM